MADAGNCISSELGCKVFGALHGFVGSQVGYVGPDAIEKYIELLRKIFPGGKKRREKIENDMRIACNKGPKVNIKCLLGYFKGYKKKVGNIKLKGFYKNFPEKNLFEVNPLSCSGDGDEYHFQLDETIPIHKTGEGVVRIQVEKLTTKHFSKKLLIGQVDIDIHKEGKNQYMLMDGGKSTGSHLDIALEKQHDEYSSVSDIFSNFLCKKAKNMFDIEEVIPEKSNGKWGIAYGINIETGEGSSKKINTVPLNCILREKIEIGKGKEGVKRNVLDLLPVGKVIENEIDGEKWRAKITATPENPFTAKEIEDLVMIAIKIHLSKNNPDTWNGKFTPIQTGILDILTSQMCEKESVISETIAKAFLIAHSKHNFNDEIITSHLPSLIGKYDAKFFSNYKAHALGIISDYSKLVNHEKIPSVTNNLKILVKAFPQWIEDVRVAIRDKIKTDIALAQSQELGTETKCDNITDCTNLYDFCTNLLNQCHGIVLTHQNLEPKYKTAFLGLLPEHLPFCDLVRNIYLKKCKQLITHDILHHRNSFSSMISDLSRDSVDSWEEAIDVIDDPHSGMGILMRLDSETANSLSEDDPLTKLYQSNFNCFSAFKRILSMDIEADCSWLYLHFERYLSFWMDLAIKKAECQLSRLLQQEKDNVASMKTDDGLNYEVNSMDSSLSVSQTVTVFIGTIVQLETFLLNLSWPNTSTYLKMMFVLLECSISLKKEFTQKCCSIYAQKFPMNSTTLAAIIRLLNELMFKSPDVKKWQEIFEEIMKSTSKDEEAEDNLKTIAQCYELLEKSKQHCKEKIEHNKDMYFSKQKDNIKKYIVQGKIDSKEENDCLLSYICETEFKNLFLNIKDGSQHEFIQRLWDLMESEISIHYNNLSKSSKHRLQGINSIDTLISVKRSLSEILKSADVTNLEKVKRDLSSNQTFDYLCPPKVAKSWDCACIGKVAQLHKITKIDHVGSSEQTISEGDTVFIQTLWTNFDQGYDILYSSDKGWIYYDQRTTEEKKQMWTVQKTQESPNLAPIFYFENVMFPGRFLNFSHDGSKWATCRRSNGKVGWMVLVQSADKSGVIAKLAVNPNDRDVLKKTSEELVSICVARKNKEQGIQRIEEEELYKVPKALVNISSGTGLNENKIILEVKSIAGLKPLTSKDHVRHLRVCIKLFYNGNSCVQNWRYTGGFKDAIAFDLAGEPIKCIFGMNPHIQENNESGEEFFVISFYDATPHFNNPFMSEKGIHNPRGLDIFIGEFVIEKEMIHKNLQDGQETQNYGIRELKDFYLSPAFKQLEHRDDRIAKKFTNTENNMLNRVPFSDGEDENNDIIGMFSKFLIHNGVECVP